MPFDEKFSELLKFKKESIYVYPNPKMIRDNKNCFLNLSIQYITKKALAIIKNGTDSTSTDNKAKCLGGK